MAIKKESLGYLLQVFDQFRAFDPTMHLPTALVFLRVAMKPGIRKTEIEKELSLSSSAAHRHIAMLTKEGDTGRTDNPGFDLVFMDADPLDSRAKRVFLTKKGAALAQSLLNILELYNADKTKG
jgi:DNA-binding MarR family transcriptional regulator